MGVFLLIYLGVPSFRRKLPLKYASLSDCLAYDDKRRLRELVKSKGLSIKAAAEATGIDYDKFRRWCSRGIT